MTEMSPDQSIIPRHNHSAIQSIPAMASAIESLAIDHPGGDDLDESFDYPEIAEATKSVLIEPFDESLPFPDKSDVYNPIVDKVIEEGIETIAFYKSFRDVNRKPLKGYWGIFFIKSRVESLINDVQIDTSAGFDECVASTLRFLYGHEIYHYKVDAACLQQEAAARLRIYRPYRRLTRSLSINDWWEEAIANYYGLSALKPNETYRPMAADEFDRFFWTLVAASPGAYAYGQDRNKVLHRTGPKGLMVNQLTHGLGLTHSTQHLGLLSDTFHIQMLLSGYKALNQDDPHLVPALGLKNCPVYWLSWTHAGVVVPFKGAAVPLDEMKHGFIQNYLKGRPEKSTDHAFYRIDNGAKVKIPNPHHKEVMTHEFKNIVRKAGMQVVEFHKERIRTKKWTLHSPRVHTLPPIA